MRFLLHFALVACVAAAASGCRFVSTPVSRVLRQPVRFHGQQITVAGRVSAARWLPDVGAIGFSLVEGRDSLLVLTDGEAPPVGKRYRAQGEFCRNIRLAGSPTPVLLLQTRSNGRGRVPHADPR